MHNYLIDTEREPIGALQHAAMDRLRLQMDGAFNMNEQPIDELGGQHFAVPHQILHGGEHFDDDPDGRVRRSISRQRRQVGTAVLPRERLFCQIRDRDLRRPGRRTY